METMKTGKKYYNDSSKEPTLIDWKIKKPFPQKLTAEVGKSINSY